MTSERFRELVALVQAATGWETWEIGREIGFKAGEYRGHMRCQGIENYLRGRRDPSAPKAEAIVRLAQPYLDLIMTCPACGDDYPPPGNVGFCTVACQESWREKHPLRPHESRVRRAA